MKIVRHRFIILFIAGIMLIGVGCKKEKTDRDYILETLENLADSVEDKNPDTALSFISDLYTDDKSRSKADLEKLLKKYTGRFRGIVVNLLEVKFIRITASSASVQADVSLSSGLAKALRKVTNIAGRYYRFKVELDKEIDFWLIKSAEWQTISKHQLSPESLDILTKALD